MPGLLHIYCGDGKGKTTAAAGLALRACGAELSVLMAQFLKDGSSSELIPLRTLPGFYLLPTPQKVKFTFRMNEAELQEAAVFCTNLLEAAFHRAREQHISLLVLDEVFAALHAGFFEETRLAALLKERPDELEVVLTGRNPPDAILKMADYVTEMQNKKHPYEKGVSARKGIEY